MTKRNKILLIVLLEISFLGYTALQEYIPFDVTEMKAAIKNSLVIQKQAQAYREKQECMKAGRSIEETDCHTSGNISVVVVEPLAKDWDYTHPIYRSFEDFVTNYGSHNNDIFDFSHEIYNNVTISKAQ